MSLMLTILTCQSTIDAEYKVDKLCELVGQTLKQNGLLAGRLASFQNRLTVVQSTEEATEPEQPPRVVQGDALKPPVHIFSSDEPTPEPQRFAFEELLSKSRVYRKMAFDGDDTFSVLSSAGRTGTWSMLSGLSLSQMSNIAILALPVYAADLNNKELYNFETITEEPEIPLQSQPESQSNQPLTPRLRLFSSWRKKPMTDSSPTPQTGTSAARSDEPPSTKTTIFGIDLTDSIRYANVAMSLENESGESFIYGYIPIVVAKCGVFLKEQGAETQDIFYHQGHPAPVRALEQMFDSPPRYGKGVSWDGFTVHDGAMLLLRYLNCLSEPVIPYNLYDRFTSEFREVLSLVQEDCSINLTQEQHTSMVTHVQRQITELPTFSRQILLYLLDVLAIFASKSDINNMTSARLVGVFHPAILSRKPQDMDTAEHRLAQDAVVFLVENQDNFFIGMASNPQ